MCWDFLNLTLPLSLNWKIKYAQVYAIVMTLSWERLGEEGSRDEIVRQHHRLSGHEFEQTLGDNEGQGSLACCSPWGCRVRHDLAAEQQ